ncbi:MAG: cache domain-containing protein [Alphaproteobacteria bacterium]
MGLRLNLLLISVIPILLFAAAMIGVVSLQTQTLSREIGSLIEERLVSDKRRALKHYGELAETAIRPLVTKPDFSPADQAQAKAVLNAMTFGEDGYFFVYDYDGTNLVHPRLDHLVGQNLWDMQDPNGNLVIQGLIARAQEGGGYHSYIWNKPSTGTEEPKIGYAKGIESWGWMLGTGLYLDDIRSEINLVNATIGNTVQRSFLWVVGFGLLAVLLAAAVVYAFQHNLQRSADQKLKALNRRIVEIQEEQAQRISRDLHDGISQLLVLTRYSLEAVEAELVPAQEEQQKILTRSRGTIDRALMELSSIARNLRPPALDQLGLQQALLTLADDYQAQSNIEVIADIEALGDKLTEAGKSALFRVAQEALTNISKHANASQVWIRLKIIDDFVELSIEDNGKGLKLPEHGGLGIANMRERLTSQGGHLEMRGRLNANGTAVIGTMPLSGEDDV